MTVQAFCPSVAGTVSIAATTSTSSAALSLPGSSAQVLVSNAGSVTAFIAFGDSTIVAVATTSTPVLAGTQQVFTRPYSSTHVATITGTGTATVYFTPGVGV